ncbi:helix-turn-helix domain-containing protein [Mucilaginibacter lacusdianchii]|uniref:helix-turn-helix domain-containing protein n=1 Tax=Mucilaginibacter lacusdianchii TaxID=2684211 RepID=UPI00131D8649|nr:helix-turn-helix transcriptional regulator [Mucilaginibacter sp. JXJ CY 39]
MDSDKQKEYLVILGRHLASLRKNRKLSYRKLAQHCDIDYSDIRKYEKGEINMTFLTMIEFAKGLDVPLKEILDLEIPVA